MEKQEVILKRTKAIQNLDKLLSQLNYYRDNRDNMVGRRIVIWEAKK